MQDEPSSLDNTTTTPLSNSEPPTAESGDTGLSDHDLDDVRQITIRNQNTMQQHVDSRCVFAIRSVLGVPTKTRLESSIQKFNLLL